jgi:hypothetical protein
LIEPLTDKRLAFDQNCTYRYFANRRSFIRQNDGFAHPSFVGVIQ